MEPRWLPGWLGKAYSRLYLSFRTEEFSFAQAQEVLARPPQQVKLVLSRLHSSRVVAIFRRSKPRVYRLLDPEGIVFIASGEIANLGNVRQERYLHLIVATCLEVMDAYPNAGVALYGSVARGSATELSDVDLLVVSNEMTGSLGSRAADLGKGGPRVRREIDFLYERGIHSSPSFYPLRPEELSLEPPILLDITEDGILLRDPTGILGGVLEGLRVKLAAKGARRIPLSDGSWYWDLAPGYEAGGVVGIP